MAEQKAPVSGLELTEQQQHIVQTALAGHNVQVFAMAGTGKTSVSLQMAQELYYHHRKRTLLLCYNKGLRADTEIRRKKMKIGDYLDVRTIHSATGFYAKQVCNTNVPLEKVLKKGQLVRECNYDVLIIDEAQDLTPLYYAACQLLIQHSPNVQLIVMGDILQRVYGFNGARAEYLMYPEQYFGRPFVQCRMSVNFRCSKKILDYINRICDIEQFRDSPLYREWFAEHEAVLKAAWGSGFQACEKAIAEEHLHPDVTEACCDTWSEEFYNLLHKEFQSHKEQQHKDHDIYMLSHSVKPNMQFVKRVIQYLGKYKNFYFVDENKAVNPKLQYNKVGLSTYCGFKGRERDHIIVFFSGVWLENKLLLEQRSNQVKDPSNLSNNLYVALSRAIKSLVVIWGAGPPSFISKMTVEIQENKEQTKFSVHDLCYRANDLYAPLQLQNICSVNTQVIGGETCFTSDEDRVFSGRHFTKENYSPVIGLAVEYAVAHALNLLPLRLILMDIANQLSSSWCTCVHCKSECGLSKDKWFAFRVKLSEQGICREVLWDDILQLALYHYCTTNPQLLRQMTGLHEISREHLSLCKERTESYLRSLPGPLSYHNRWVVDVDRCTVQGESDFIAGATVIELKITSAISDDYVMQSMLYSALYSVTSQTPLQGPHILAPNLGTVATVTFQNHVDARYLLEHAVRRKIEN
jgi:hypothetical protein